MATTTSPSLSRLLRHLLGHSRRPSSPASLPAFSSRFRAFSSRPASTDITRPLLFPSTSSCGVTMGGQEYGNLSELDPDEMAPSARAHVKEGGGKLFQPGSAIWVPSTCGCMGHSNVIRSPRQPLSCAGSHLQSNNYATESEPTAESRFKDKAKIRALMEAKGLKKQPGWSRIEIQGQLNTFLVDDRSHPRNREIREELQRMLGLMKEAGYVADLRCVLRDIPESEKENALQHHSERLAMALGHISLPPRAPLRVIKNLRVCNDCHVATKYFAYIYKREIIVRDATRFHHFKEGYCSCGDYW